MNSKRFYYGTDFIVWLPSAIGMLLRLDSFRIMACNFSELIMISFFVNLSIAMPLSDANVLINLEIALPRQTGYHHQQNYA